TPCSFPVLPKSQTTFCMWITIPVVMLHRFVLDVDICVGRRSMRDWRRSSMMASIRSMSRMMQMVHGRLLMRRRHHASFRSPWITAILHHFMATGGTWRSLLEKLVLLKVRMAARDHSSSVQSRYSSMMVHLSDLLLLPFRNSTLDDKEVHRLLNHSPHDSAATSENGE
ncbi:hypothetical protein RvY_12878, partial [Ramazzottius varieornatus]